MPHPCVPLKLVATTALVSRFVIVTRVLPEQKALNRLHVPNRIVVPAAANKAKDEFVVLTGAANALRGMMEGGFGGGGEGDGDGGGDLSGGGDGGLGGGCGEGGDGGGSGAGGGGGLGGRGGE